MQDGDIILSFEDWIFKLYDKSYLNDRKIKKSINIPKIDLNRYKGIELWWFTCFEAINFVYNIEWINMNTWRLKWYLKIMIALFVICMIIFIIWVIVWTQLPDNAVVYINNILDNE